MKNMRNKFKIFAGAGLLFAAILLGIVSRLLPGFAQWYSTNLYPVWVGSVGRIADLFPFSLSEVLLYILLLGVLTSGIRLLMCGIWKRAGKKEIYAVVINLCLLVGSLSFLYMLNCGINYYRSPFSESSGMKVEEYSVEDLKEVCLWLTGKVNEYGRQVERDETGVMILDSSLQKNAVKSMKKLGRQYPELNGYYPLPKGLMNSWILSVQELSGIYSPFTIEANYNQDMTGYNIPFTACHELSHLRGFMQEQEADFIAFLACIEAEEAAFNYSGNLVGWIQCMNVLYKVDYDVWEEVRNQLAPEVEQDLSANHKFWAKYDGTVAEVSNKINDTYLKANGQLDGVKSYNRMADLIVAYYINM